MVRDFQKLLKQEKILEDYCIWRKEMTQPFWDMERKGESSEEINVFL